MLAATQGRRGIGVLAPATALELELRHCAPQQRFFIGAAFSVRVPLFQRGLGAFDRLLSLLFVDGVGILQCHVRQR